MAKKIEIFKPGRHTALNGSTLDFSADQLAQTVAAYDPQKYQAPLVIGHPKLDAPAYGWVKGLEFSADLLQAEPEQVVAEFAAACNAGRFKRVSASFFTPDSPRNPVPGVYYLRHVGFLGAAEPAIQGLKPVEFAADEEGVVEFGWDDRLVAGLLRKLKNLLIGKFGADDAEAALPEWDLEALAEEALRPEEPAAPPSPMYAAPEGGKESPMETPEQIAAREQREAEFAAREAALVTREAAARHADNVAFAASLVSAGTLLPAQQDQVVALLDFAGGLEQTHVVEFGAGEEKTAQPVAQALRSFLQAQPKVVEFGSMPGDDEEDGKAVAFAAAPGYTVDQASLEVHNKALAYQGKHPGTDYMTAVKAVS